MRCINIREGISYYYPKSCEYNHVTRLILCLISLGFVNSLPNVCKDPVPCETGVKINLGKQLPLISMNKGIYI